jgi:hypothetical protein
MATRTVTLSRSDSDDLLAEFDLHWRRDRNSACTSRLETRCTSGGIDKARSVRMSVTGRRGQTETRVTLTGEAV